MSQVLGFDFGTFSIGIAVGQAITGTASPLTALKAKNGQPDWEQLGRIIKEWQPQLLVVGLPLNMDGTEQEMTDKARKFGNRLHGRFGLPVFMQDERLTTVAAKEDLFSRGGYKQLQKDKVDSASAQLILEDYFNQNSSPL
jgi:putative holliday junction resolvase